MNELRLNELLNKIYYEYLDSHEAEEFIIYFKRLKQDKDNLQSKIDKVIKYLNKSNVSLNELTKDFEIIPTNMIMIEFLKGEREDILKENKIEEIPQFKGTMEQLDNLSILKEDK